MKLPLCGNAGNPCCATAVYVAALCELATEGQRELDREGDPALLLAAAREAREVGNGLWRMGRD